MKTRSYYEAELRRQRRRELIRKAAMWAILIILALVWWVGAINIAWWIRAQVGAP